MGKKLSPTLNDSRQTDIHAIYTETVAHLKATLLPFGFKISQETGGGLGALILFKKDPLVARLFLDVRDDICVFSAESGNTHKSISQDGRETTSKYDLFLYLSEPDIRERFPRDLEFWLQSHNA